MLFIKHLDSRRVTTLLVYVDDIIVTRNDEKERQTLRQCLTKEFDIKELGWLKYFLGIEVAHSKQGIYFLVEICNGPPQGNRREVGV